MKMKGARFIGLLLAGLLTFSTLANDYLVANAQEDVIENVEETQPAEEVKEEVTLTEVSEQETPVEEAAEEVVEEATETPAEEIGTPEEETPAEEIGTPEEETPAETIEEQAEDTSEEAVEEATEEAEEDAEAVEEEAAEEDTEAVAEEPAVEEAVQSCDGTAYIYDAPVINEKKFNKILEKRHESVKVTFTKNGSTAAVALEGNYSFPGNVTAYYIHDANTVKKVDHFYIHTQGNNLGVVAVMTDGTTAEYIPSSNSNSNNYEKFIWAKGPAAKPNEIQGAGYITFKYYPESAVNDKEAITDRNSVKYTVDIVKEDGTEVSAQDKAAFLAGANFQDITFNSNVVTVADAFGAFEIPGLKLDGCIAYWYWYGSYTETKVPVTVFRNFGDVSTKYATTFLNNIGFLAPAQGEGSDYDLKKFGSDAKGYFAYDPKGTLRIVFKVDSNCNPYSTTYKNGDTVIDTYTDTIETDTTTYQTRYTYYPINKLTEYSKEYMEATYTDMGEFVGWSTSATDKNIVDASFFQNPASSDITLYAVWNKAEKTTYTVIHYTQVLKGNLYKEKNYSVALTQSNIEGEVGDEIAVSSLVKSFDGFAYWEAATWAKKDNKDIFTKISADSYVLDADAGKNVICLFYDFDVPNDENKVAFFLLLPNKEVPKDSSAQPTANYYPLYGNDTWLGSAKKISNSVYDYSGVEVEKYITSRPESEIAAYLAKTYGEGTRPVWYTYKNVGNADYHIDGYVLGAKVNVNYIANYSDITGNHTNEFYSAEAVTGNYTVSNYDADTFTWPARKGYKLAGWNTKADGTGTGYKPGDVFLLTNSINLYAIWELSETDYSVEVYLQSVEDWMANTADCYKIAASSVSKTAATDSEVVFDVTKVFDATETGYEVNDKIYTFDSENSVLKITNEVKAEGANVIKLCFKLKEAKITLDNNGVNATYTMSTITDVANNYYAPKNVKLVGNTITYTALSNDFKLPLAADNTGAKEFLGWKKDGNMFTQVFGKTKVDPEIEASKLANDTYVAQWGENKNIYGAFLIRPGLMDKKATLIANEKKAYADGTVKDHSKDWFTPSVADAKLAAYITANYSGKTYADDDLNDYILDMNFKKDGIVSGTHPAKIERKDGKIYITADVNGYSYTVESTNITWYTIKDYTKANGSEGWHIDGFPNWEDIPPTPINYNVNLKAVEAGDLTKEIPELAFDTNSFSVPYQSAIKTAVGNPDPEAKLSGTDYYFVGWKYLDSEGKDLGTVLGDSKMPISEDGITIYALYSKKNEITLTAGTKVFTYNGEAQGVYTYTGTPEGLVISGISVKTETTDVTTTPIETVILDQDKLKIEKDGVDVTKEYKASFAKGTLTINPAEITIPVKTKKQTYNGQPLAAELDSIVYPVNGHTVISNRFASATDSDFKSITAVGSEEYNATEVILADADGNDVTSNYTIVPTKGTLTIDEYAGEILVTTIGGTYVYDGNAHGAAVSVSASAPAPAPEPSPEPVPTPSVLGFDDITGFPEGYTVKAASSSATATHVSEGTVVATADTLIIVNAEGEDVTSKLNIKKVDGTITVTPAALTVTTDSASKKYDGTEITASGKVTGFAAGETATFKTTGSQIQVGSSKNTYSLKFNKTAVESDYEVTATLGTLTIDMAYGPGPEPTPEEPTPTGETTTTIPDQATPLADAAGVLGARRGIEADDASVLGARRTTDDAAVLGARRDAATQDENNIALYLMLMGIATGVGAAYTCGRRRKKGEN